MASHKKGSINNDVSPDKRHAMHSNLLRMVLVCDLVSASRDISSSSQMSGTADERMTVIQPLAT